MDDLYQSACRSTIAEFSQDIVLSNASNKSGNVRPTPLGIAKSEEVYPRTLPSSLFSKIEFLFKLQYALDSRKYSLR